MQCDVTAPSQVPNHRFFQPCPSRLPYHQISVCSRIQMEKLNRMCQGNLRVQEYTAELKLLYRTIETISEREMVRHYLEYR
ncbi:hypothetical protein M378DRAFT_656495 [Amanita muscaria Koide BX008]|uniref:Uncharacterized protein n=1 Tax=Amanita muscaria (strain Koide BX008) TaxID=946122 RepID=A0A0C2WQ00_AMAMK|nr:hypothetical protein M378DRAFT_656495 [Amanita muscaria Koide BX008]